MTTPEELLKVCDEIEALLKEATPGPWKARNALVYLGGHGGFSLHNCPQPEENASFIAALHNAAKPLIDAARESVRLLAELHKANSQAEHFEREWYLYLCGDELDKVRKERDEAYERAAQVCESEAVDFVATGEESDEAYNQGISDAAMAIRALKDKPL